MNKLSGVIRHRRLPDYANFYRALLLAVLVCVWPTAGTPGQSTVTGSQQERAAQKATVTYSCPMHPTVKSLKPGKCPKCKMDLRRVKTDSNSSTSVGANLDSRAANEPVTRVKTSTDPIGVLTAMGSSRKMVIPDIEVLDQDGNRIRFYTDLIKDRTIAINFIFTNCTTICPPLAATFARVQKQLGDKVGKDVHFISISVDPVTDTPERLKAWGAKFKRGPGWTFVTGDKEEMDKLLNALGASVSRREDHTPAVIVGNDLKGVWTRTYGLANPTQIVGLILNMIEGKTDEPLTKEPNRQ